MCHDPREFQPLNAGSTVRGPSRTAYNRPVSSDLFYARVTSVNGSEVVFDVLTGVAGRPDDIATSRSFALLLLSDALRRARDEDISPEERRRLSEKEKASALWAELERAADDWDTSDSWMIENVGRFVESCELVERRNDLGWDELDRREAAIQRQLGDTLDADQRRQLQTLRWQRCHQFRLRVVVTDPRWAEHLEPGLAFGTTAYDVLPD